MLQTLQRIILEKQELILNRILQERTLQIPSTHQIKIFTGPRRCGKTCLMQLEARNYDLRRVLYLDFEDERLVGFQSLGSYDVVLDSYHSLFPDLQPVLFFDEVQALPNWHLFLKRLHEHYPEIHVTGSNANLLSRDIATYLTGRSLSLKARPFSFREFVYSRREEIAETSFKLHPGKWLNLFNEYRVWGGFPEVIFTDSKLTVLQGIYQLILFKDLASKLKLSDYALRLIIGKLVENIGKPYSMNSVYNKIRQFYPLSRPTCNDYINALELPFLTQTITLWRKSFVARESERKTYLIDNGFIKLHSVGEDWGKLLENCVFNELSRRHDQIYYYRTNNRLEVDFLVIDGEQKQLIQVCETISDPDTRAREFAALLTAMQELGLDSAILLTAFEESTIVQDHLRIEVIPAWKWMLSES